MQWKIRKFSNTVALVTVRHNNIKLVFGCKTSKGWIKLKHNNVLKPKIMGITPEYPMHPTI